MVKGNQIRRAYDHDRNVLVLGAVAVDAVAADFWSDLIAALSLRQVACDLLLFASYARLNRALLRGDIQLAWNTPLAWLAVSAAAETTGRKTAAVAMRDIDRDRRGVVVVAKDASIAHPLELRGKRIGVGNWNHPLATLMPLLALEDQGLVAGRDFELVVFDRHGAVHGDHDAGEREAALALQQKRIDAACLTADTLGRLAQTEGHAGGQFAGLRASAAHVVLKTPAQDACNLTVIEPVSAEVKRLVATLWALPGQDAAVQRLFALFGFCRWLPGRVTEYAELKRAVHRFGVDADARSGDGRAGAHLGLPTMQLLQKRAAIGR